jgi:DNA-binding MarR family transcriptional regulator
MMRALWQEARDRIHEAFAEGGYGDVRAEHLAVLQHPGQAINHLLRHLERAGYLERYTDPAGARLVALTDSGHTLMDHIQAVAATIEREWAQDVGVRRLEELRSTLTDLQAARQARLGMPARRPTG